MVHEVLGDEHAPRAREDVGERPGCGAVHRGQGAAVQVEPGEGLEHVVGSGEHRDVRMGGEHVREGRAVAVPQQEGARGVSGVQCAADHLGGLGEEDAVLRVDATAQGRVRHGRVGGQAGVGEVLDPLQAHLAGPDLTHPRPAASP